ncbi:MAG: SsrA-binding protein SmpB [Pseudomonadales bacterium]|nr:SsrA-binding protein SmpB [Pseudomonadales bacterium]
MNKKKSKSGSNTIVQNKKARHDYFIEDKFEAGISLQGWEVKSLRAGKAQLTDSYVLLKEGEAWLLGCLITPMSTVSTHFVVDPQRTRKLLLNSKEIARLCQATQQKGYTCLCTAMYWKGHLVKCEIVLGKGKAKHDKRETEKERDWSREQQRLLRDKG